MTVENNRITDVQIIGLGETYSSKNDQYVAKALSGTAYRVGVAEQLTGQHIAGTLQVDSVAGATSTSLAIVDAVQSAISEHYSAE